ncbi:discoidin domain-containing protein [Herbiconiux sp. 11R-BC]|uniref:discoidin domain-containing protein n=1 Tax=Herbiconiux sp. 11R-BC TaxID=3111637 RepID=UPI003BFB1D13
MTVAVAATGALVAVSAVAGITATASASTGAGGKVDVVYSGYNEAAASYRLSPQTPTVLSPVSDAQAALPTIALDPSITYQTWDGFGGSLEDTSVYNLSQLSSSNRASALSALFDPSTGNGFNLMRLPIGCADFCRDAPAYWTYDDNGGSADPTLANFSIQKDVDNGLIAMLQQILTLNPQAKFYSSMWSAPAWMKTTNSIIGPASGGLCPTDGTEPRVHHGASTGSSVDYYPVLAQYYVKYIQAYQAQGIPIYAVTLQNEPNITMPYPATCFSPAQLADFAVVLKAAFTSAGIGTKIWGLDDNENNSFPYTDALLANPGANAAVDGLGWHNYAGTEVWQPSAVEALYPAKTAHITEITNGADRLVEYFRHNVSSYSYWVTQYQFMPGPGPGYWQNSSSTNSDFYTPSVVSFGSGGTSTFQLNAWYYSFGQFSRYIQPGAVRIDSTDRLNGNITNVAFQNPDGTIVTVVVNRIPTSTNSAVQNTPAATIRVVTPDGQFTDTIPGDTVATYVYTPTTGSAVSTAGATATASASKAGYGATQALDGSTGTVWTSGADEAAGQTFTVDLGAAKTFDQLTLNAGSLASDAPAGYQVQLSNDGTTWGSAVATGSGTAAVTNVAFASQTARFVRVTQTGTASHWWSIASFSLYDSTRGLLPIVGATVTGSPSSTTDTAAKAVDGIQSTRWSTGVAQAPGQSFTVDLGSARSVNALELDNAGSPGDQPRGYSVATSTNGTAWSAAVAVGAGFSTTTKIAFPTTTARYLRVTQTGTAPANYWSIAELRVYNLSPVVLDRTGWTATSSTGSGAANVLDGSASTRFTTGSAQASGQWLQLDLGRSIQTTGADLDATTSTGDYARSYTAAVSLDGTNWTTVAQGAGQGADVRAQWPTRDARFVRITLGAAATASWSVGELNVWGAPTTAAPGTPLSRTGWSATASASAAASPASAAIDGLLDTRWSDGSAQAGGEWFQLDLGSAQTFSKVQLIAAGGLDNADGDYPRGYELYLPDGSGWKLVAAGSASTNAVTITVPTQSARYLNIHQTGTDAGHWWSIAEIQVLQ